MRDMIKMQFNVSMMISRSIHVATDDKTSFILWLSSIPYDHMDYTVHGVLQARILEWIAFSFSKGSS